MPLENGTYYGGCLLNLSKISAFSSGHCIEESNVNMNQEKENAGQHEQLVYSGKQ